MTRPLCILSVGYDPTLLHMRTMVLRSNGYVIKEAQSVEQAQLLAESDLIDLIVICHTVPESDQVKLITAARRARRLLPILCVTDQEFGCVARGCEAASSSPLELLESVREAVRSHPM